MCDLSVLVPEARPVVAEAAKIYQRHTKAWFIGLIIHGSALKGGVIPGCSDIDLQLYLEEAAFSECGHLPLDICLTIHKDLSRIDPSPFRYIQCYALPPSLSPGQIGPIPGAYHIILGELPVPEATPEQVRHSAIEALERLDPDPSRIVRHLLHHGEGRLFRELRLLCTEVWPILYQVLTLREGEVLAIWNLPKESAIEHLPVTEPIGRDIRTFYRAVKEHYANGEKVETALAAIPLGVSFLRSAKLWYEQSYSAKGTSEVTV